MDHAVAINTNNFVVQRSTMALANEGTNLCMFFYLKIFQRMFIEFPAAYVTNFKEISNMADDVIWNFPKVLNEVMHILKIQVSRKHIHSHKKRKFDEDSITVNKKKFVLLVFIPLKEESRLKRA